ncbi:hypothetical protein Val02_38390 [Virgisporangium aliadipatigenens]|uniref:Activator of Hsp90 ATPase homologue 1/2-like C-terminal domain-containing protein n=1 Tax=Virgisporangium aliadipatigenens TaxID=741659 RepID=A0A8J3YMS7_9ACTN|nr:SRPBCC family protein [Virgisporangium aliadipatigenens]GIJ46953.1 hypothetical protein Val02_38390 [Virgisporangium aliadipatigenens]
MNESLREVDGRNQLYMERRFAHPIEVVWRAITDPDRLAAWFPYRVEWELRVGAPIRFSAEGDEGTGVITELAPPHVIEYTWDNTVLRWELRPEGEGTLLVFTQAFGDRPSAASYAAGWETCLDFLTASLDGAPEPEVGDLAVAHERYVAQFGLDRGYSTHLPDGRWAVRFERQLTRPADQVWAALTGGVEPVVGGPAPAPATTPEFADGQVTEVEPGRQLTYEWQTAERIAGQVRYELEEGTGQGPRLVVTQTGPQDLDATEAALKIWRDKVEAFAGEVAAQAP